MDSPFAWTADDVLLDAAPITVRQKWRGAVTERSGFVAIPTILLKSQARLGLTATDLVVLSNLLAHWWDPRSSVWPRSTTIANRMGVTERTVHRSLDKMVKAGLLIRRAEMAAEPFSLPPWSKRWRGWSGRRSGIMANRRVTIHVDLAACIRWLLIGLAVLLTAYYARPQAEVQRVPQRQAAAVEDHPSPGTVRSS